MLVNWVIPAKPDCKEYSHLSCPTGVHQLQWSKLHGAVYSLRHILSSSLPSPLTQPSPRMSATLFVQPLDLVKNRMQLSGKQALVYSQTWRPTSCNFVAGDDGHVVCWTVYCMMKRDWGGSNLVVRNTSIISLNVRLWDPFFNKWFYTKPVKEVKVYCLSKGSIKAKNVFDDKVNDVKRYSFSCFDPSSINTDMEGPEQSPQKVLFCSSKIVYSIIPKLE